MGTEKVLEWGKKLRNSEYKFEFRSLYCTCVPFCYIASGNFDFAIQHGKMGIWDTVAPKFIIEEAGGVCEVTQHNEFKYTVIAGNKENVEIIKKIINED